MIRKPKEVRLGVRCEPEGETGWLWKEGSFEFRFDPMGGALNLAIRHGDGPWQPSLHCQNLPEAVMFAGGFNAGYQAATRTPPAA